MVWHVVVFEEQYQAFGYFEGEPSFILGLLSIIIQGFVFSLLYPHLTFKGSVVARGLEYSLPIALFFWTPHVMAFVMKQIAISAAVFIAMQSQYSVMQFTIYGVLIGLIYKIYGE